MYVPPFFPEPITVHGNVAEAAYDVRLNFIRRLILWHALTLIVVVVVAFWVPLQLPLPVAILGYLGCIGLHSLIRQSLHQSPKERFAHLIVLPATLFGCGQVARIATDSGFVVWPLGLGVIGGILYMLVCGRDFSFVGQYFFGAVVVIGATFVGKTWHSEAVPYPWLVIVIGLIGLFYYVYDLAMVLKRRKPTEILCATVDPYYDVLNIITYIPRVVVHWRKYILKW